MPDLNYYRLVYYVIRRICNEITAISGTSMKWVNAVDLGLELCLFTSMLTSSSASMNYLMKVGENLIFFVNSYIVYSKSGRHAGVICACPSPCCLVFLIKYSGS